MPTIGIFGCLVSEPYEIAPPNDVTLPPSLVSHPPPWGLKTRAATIVPGGDCALRAAVLGPELASDWEVIRGWTNVVMTARAMSVAIIPRAWPRLQIRAHRERQKTTACSLGRNLRDKGCPMTGTSARSNPLLMNFHRRVRTVLLALAELNAFHPSPFTLEVPSCVRNLLSTRHGRRAGNTAGSVTTRTPSQPGPLALVPDLSGEIGPEILWD